MPNSSGEDYVNEVEKFFIRKGISSQLDGTQKSRDFYSFLFRSFLKNIFNGLHGGVIRGVAERVAVACVRTVVAADKDLFLGELSLSYLSSAQLHEVCTVEGENSTEWKEFERSCHRVLSQKH